MCTLYVASAFRMIFYVSFIYEHLSFGVLDLDKYALSDEYFMSKS